MSTMLLGKSGEIASERTKRLSQSEHKAQLWVCLLVKGKSHAVKNNTAWEPGMVGPWIREDWMWPGRVENTFMKKIIRTSYEKYHNGSFPWSLKITEVKLILFLIRTFLSCFAHPFSASEHVFQSPCPILLVFSLRLSSDLLSLMKSLVNLSLYAQRSFYSLMALV